MCVLGAVDLKDVSTPSSGSINFLNATQLHVLEESTSQNMCVRYSFQNTLSMRSPANQKVGNMIVALTSRIRLDYLSVCVIFADVLHPTGVSSHPQEVQ